LPTNAGKLLETRSCRLTTHDTPLGLLRSYEHVSLHDHVRQYYRGKYPNMNENDLDDHIRGLGLLAMPFLRGAGSILLNTFKTIGQLIKPVDILKAIAPVVGEMMTQNITGDQALARSAGMHLFNKFGSPIAPHYALKDDKEEQKEQ